MWGSTFADLAKKAHELQEQAKEQASHLHIASPTFFSLDALQGATHDPPGAALFATPQPSFHSSSHSSEIKTQPQPSLSSSSQQTSKAATTTLPLSPATTTTTKKDNKRPSLAMLPSNNREEITGGWDDDDDDALDVPDANDEEEEAESLVVRDLKMPFENSRNHSELANVDLPPPPDTEETGWDSDNDIDDDALDVQDDDEEETFMMTTLHDDDKVNNVHFHVVVRESTNHLADQQPPPEKESSLDKVVVVSENVKDEQNVLLEEEALEKTPKSTRFPAECESHVGTGVDKTHESITRSDDDDDEHNEVVASSKNHEMVTPLEPKEKDTTIIPETSHVLEPCSVVVDDDDDDDEAHESIGIDNNDNEEQHDSVASYNDFEKMTPEPKKDMALAAAFAHVVVVVANGDDDFVDEKCGTDDLDNLVVGESKETVEKEKEVRLAQVFSLPNVDDSNVKALDGTAKSQMESPNDDAVLETNVLKDEFVVEEDAHDVASVGSMTDNFDDKFIEEHVVVVEKTNNVVPDAEAAVSVTDDVHKEAYIEKVDEEMIAPDSPFQSSRAFLQQQEELALELQRLKDAHQAEISNLEQRHAHQLEEALASFHHEQCQVEHHEMEQRFMKVIRGHEGQLQTLMSENEGYQLTIGALKKEVDEKQALLEQRDSAMGDVNASHYKTIGILEQKVKDMEEAASLAKTDTDKLKAELQATKNELETSNEAYATLKARVKVVATELKERRVECRTLGAKVTDLNETNEQLETQITNLQSKLSDRDRNHTENDRQTKLLKEQIEKIQMDLNKTEHALKERDAIGEKALSAYKKKAQNALAAANARAAAANQAKEEAEMESTTARTIADDAVQRARVAEASGKDALAEAKAHVRDMEHERGILEKRALDATEALQKSIAEAQYLKNSMDVSRATQEKLVEDVRLISHEREQERAQRWQLEHQLTESQRNLDLLYEEVGTLREELRQATAAAVAAAAAASAPAETEKDLWSHARRTSSDTADRSDAEGTIAMLESELRDANRAIKELKDALKTAIADQGSNGYGHNNSASSGVETNHHQSSSAAAPAGNESMPLFFAMEKQAELSTARDEINRLANLLGDAEFSKMEALEAMEDMKRQMEEAEARRKRLETFGAGGANHNTVGSAAAPVAATSGAPGQDDADGNVNLEYLKNIMLRYLNAKTAAEKRALVPVLSAVLCLTPQEQAAVFKNMEQSTGLESVGMALFESIAGSQSRR